ncbi:lytic transglycosylase domain-containing protein [Burkholderia seminalis]|uniref:lytic transglycosylase domain-containing protein n=1 Tax=Burkholderia seminalis TaxID=488731 RepID=UPI00158A8CC2|nr:lytic transglycosylase domain-containing protein [Burkholderia seminalis]
MNATYTGGASGDPSNVKVTAGSDDDDSWWKSAPLVEKASPLDAALFAENVTGQLADVARGIYGQETRSGKNVKTSNAGARGGMQVKPDTFKRFSDKGWSIDDPEQNARAAVRYIKHLSDLSGGDPKLISAGYYGGEGAIPKAMVGIGVKDPRNKNAPDTLQYASQVAGRMPQDDSWWKSAPIVSEAGQTPQSNGATADKPAESANPTTLGQLSRQAGLAGREITEGVTAIPQMMGNAANAAINLGIQGVNRVAGTNIPRLRSVTSVTEELLDRAGLPRPESGAERLAGAGVSGLAGGLSGAGLAQRASMLASGPVARYTLSQLASNPSFQGVSGATGAMSGEAARQSGAGPVGQMVASVAGGMAPAAAAAAGAGGTRYLLRGVEENIPRVRENIKTFRDAGTTPSVGQATETRNARAAESVLAKVPGGAGPMASYAERQGQAIGKKAESIADDLATKISPTDAGNVIEKGISGPGGFVSRFKAGQKVLYDKLDQYIKPNASVKMGNTERALASMNQDIEGAETLSKFFKNNRIQDIESALKADTAGTRAGVMIVPPNATTAEQRAAASHGLLRRVPDQLREGQAPLSGSLSGSRNPYTGVTRPNVRTAGQPSSVTVSPSRSAPAGYGSGREVGIPGGSPTNELPYEAVKKLRTLVGNELESTSLVSDVPRSKWKALYAALSNDLEGAAKATGNADAVKAMNRANAFSRAGHARIEDVLDKVVRQGTPEKVYQLATGDMKTGATWINAIMRSLQPAERDVVRSAFIRRMGMAKAGQQGAEGDMFSTQTFLTNWNSISPEAKRVMFAGTEGRLRENLNQIAKAAENIKEGSKVFANPSGTAPAATQIGFIASLGSAAATGHWPAAGLLLGGAGAANLITRKMITNPDFVEWLANSTKLSASAVPSALNALAQTARSLPDDVQSDVDHYVSAIREQQ